MRRQRLPASAGPVVVEVSVALVLVLKKILYLHYEISVSRRYRNRLGSCSVTLGLLLIASNLSSKGFQISTTRL